MKKILVIGATGKQGYAVVQALLEREYSVRAFTRNKENERLKALDSERLDIFEGDLNSADDLRDAMSDVDGVYSVQPIHRDDVQVELQQGRNIMKSAKAQGIEHIVYSTAGGVNRDRTGPHFEILAQLENELADSGLHYTLVKPSFFMDNFLRIVQKEDEHLYIPEFITPNIPFAMISTRDIAQIAMHVFEHPQQYDGQSLEIASDKRTLNDIVSTFETVTDIPTSIRGEFTSGTAERSWLEEKGYKVDFELMSEINPDRLTLDRWIARQQW
ncbi:NmrA family NAD(P)-binding protein [Staphylococcus argensis]|uniref:NmrA family NAD(P)-binding protein n=1 Tax=Staphylococcus argensis TaxID=1607738 RepID=UPI0022840317|nr:NmrA family NAD(P)-binding protein [Staphylococcus argensis]MCY6991663.1 NmrA family NAD(P)-binding protein [Staphylococcus argensis]